MNTFSVESRIIELIYQCVLRDDLLPGLLQTIRALFDSNSAILIYVDPATADADFRLASGVVEDPRVQELYRAFAHLDPCPRVTATLKLGHAVSTDLLFPPDTEEHRPFLEGFLHPSGLAGALGGVVAKGKQKIGYFVLHRGVDRDVFDERDIARFESFLPHVARMLALRGRFFDLATRLAVIDRALDTTGKAMMTFDRRGHVVQANLLARSILARDDGLALDRCGRLVLADEKANDRLKAFRTDESCPTTVLRVPRDENALPYLLRLSRLPKATSGRSHPVLSICISDPSRIIGDKADSVLSALGLTPSSVKLVGALLRGQTLESYAKQAKLSRNTVKFHLRSAFKAIGVRRQSDLLRIAGTLVHDLETTELTE